MQTTNPAYQIAHTKARKFSATIMNELEAKADTPLLIQTKVNVNTLCQILKEGTEIGNKVNEGEFKKKLMAAIMKVTTNIFLAEAQKYISTPQKKKLLEQLRKCTVSVTVPNLN
jgi:hypothetical protein